jgi:hypothetical protein
MTSTVLLSVGKTMGVTEYVPTGILEEMAIKIE